MITINEIKNRHSLKISYFYFTQHHNEEKFTTFQRATIFFLTPQLQQYPEGICLRYTQAWHHHRSKHNLLYPVSDIC